MIKLADSIITSSRVCNLTCQDMGNTEVIKRSALKRARSRRGSAGRSANQEGSSVVVRATEFCLLDTW